MDMDLKMDITMDAQELVAQGYRREWWVGGIAFILPFLIMGIHKYWFYQYIVDRIWISWTLIFFGLPLPFCYTWLLWVKKKLLEHLGQSFKDDLLGEIKLLQILSNQNTWLVYQRKSQWMLICTFFSISQIGFAFAIFAYYHL